MNHTYAFPVALALTFHAVLFLGSGKPPAKSPGAPVPPATPPTEVDKLMQLLKPEEPAAAPEETGVHSDTPIIDRPPGIREVPPSVIPSELTPTQDYVPTEPGGHAEKLIPEALRPGYSDGNSTSRILSPSDLDEAPRASFQKEPAYPVELRRDCLSGTVVVAFNVDEKGRVHDVRVVKTSDRRFDAATVAAVSEWRFVPGTKKGIPVRFHMCLPVVFKYNEL